jgi:3-oxoacyl-[acyl-carrier-protein] synthase III
MHYSRVYLDAIGYELPPIVVSSEELETRLRPVYKALRIQEGQLEAMTGIVERRWWEPGFSLAQGATAAARKALARSSVRPADIEAVIYTGVCRENFEPATACKVAHALQVSPDAYVYDISNACLGVLNGILDLGNRIQLGQIRAGLVVSCETAREINDLMIDRLLREPGMELFKVTLATLTGGSGAVAVLVTDDSFSRNGRRRLLGGMAQNAPQHHGLCRWGLTKADSSGNTREVMATDSIAVLKYGVELGVQTWKRFLREVDWTAETADRVICHQVGSSHRDTILQSLGISLERDYSTFPYLGNMGTVSLPLTAALAEEREFLSPGHRVAFLGIGSGLNCLMLGVEW